LVEGGIFVPHAWDIVGFLRVGKRIYVEVLVGAMAVKRRTVGRIGGKLVVVGVIGEEMVMSFAVGSVRHDGFDSLVRKQEADPKTKSNRRFIPKLVAVWTKTSTNDKYHFEREASDVQSLQNKLAQTIL
jgi:hypothetical protein